MNAKRFLNVGIVKVFLTISWYDIRKIRDQYFLYTRILKKYNRVRELAVEKEVPLGMYTDKTGHFIIISTTTRIHK